jgi:cytochrome c biogenesis protein CcmG/thiol:disulfide interchange protein DsbE
MSRFWRFGPALLGGLLLALFAMGLTLGPPENLDSAYENKPLPAFTLPPLYEGGTALDTAILTSGKPVLLNVFASWCAPCRVEHPQLMALAENKIPIYAVNYKDTRNAAKRFLNRLGNPYSAIGFDGRGQAALDLGVYGVPETFIINGQGHVVARHVGPLTPEDVRALILPYFMDSPKEAQHAVSR